MPTQDGNKRLYVISTDFTGLTESQPDPDSLRLQLKSLPLSVNVLDAVVEPDDDKVCALTDALPSSGDQTQLDATVAAHTGVPFPTEPLAAFSLIAMEHSITATSMSYLAGVRADITRATDEPDYAACLITGEIKVSGTGLAMRIVDSGQASLMLADYTHADTAGVWQPFSLQTQPGLTDGPDTYAWQATLGGATSAEVRGVSMLFLG